MTVNYSQCSLLPILNQFLQSKNQPILKRACCYGLVVHRGIKKFTEDVNEHSISLQKVCQFGKERIDEISKSVDLEKFCLKIVNLQKKNLWAVADIIKNVEGEKRQVCCSFDFTAPYAYNPTTKSVDHLSELLQLIASIETTVDKYIFLDTGDHLMDLSTNKDSYSYYDPNSPVLPADVPFEPKSCQNQFDSIVSCITANYASGQSLSFAVQVLTSTDISSSFAESKALKVLQQKVLQGDLNKCSANGFNPLMIAIRNHSLINAKKLYELGAKPDSIEENCSPLIIAIGMKDSEAVQTLIGMEANVNLRWNKMSPTWLAVFVGKLEITKLLLAKGGKMWHDDEEYNLSPKEIAEYGRDHRTGIGEESKDFDELIKVLEEAGPEIHSDKELNISQH